METTAPTVVERASGRAGGQPTLEAIGITKDFSTLRANDNIDFAILPGEIHALVVESLGDRGRQAANHRTLRSSQGARRRKPAPHRAGLQRRG